MDESILTIVSIISLSSVYNQLIIYLIKWDLDQSLVHSGEDNETNWSTSRMHGSRRRRDLRIARNKRRSQRLVDNNDNRGNSLEEIEMQATSANETQPQTSREQQNVSQSSDEQTVAQTYAQHNTLQTVEEQHNDGVNGDNNDSLRISSNNVSTDVITINDTCIDLTSEHDEYELNNIDDNEIECVAINIRNCADLNNIQRNLLERSRPRLSDVARDRSRSPLRRHEDIIDITNSPPPAYVFLL